MNNYDYLFKFILIGDSTVGKTCILTRFVDGFFKQDSDPTIGVEFGSKVLKCENDLTVRLQVWDTAGQESFRSITRYTLFCFLVNSLPEDIFSMESSLYKDPRLIAWLALLATTLRSNQNRVFCILIYVELTLVEASERCEI